MSAVESVPRWRDTKCEVLRRIRHCGESPWPCWTAGRWPICPQDGRSLSYPRHTGPQVLCLGGWL